MSVSSPRKVSDESSKNDNFNSVDFDQIIDQLRHIYKTKIKPVEETYQFGAFHSPPLTDADIAAKPMVLLLGQYSVGKKTRNISILNLF